MLARPLVFILFWPLTLFPAFSSSHFASSRIADKPNGVAAQPSPKMLAIILEIMYSVAGCSLGKSGNSTFITGRIPLLIPAIRPESLAICIMPVQSAITPSIVIQSVTASLEELIAASPTAAPCPLQIPMITPKRIIPAHKIWIIRPSPLPLLFSDIWSLIHYMRSRKDYTSPS